MREFNSFIWMESTARASSTVSVMPLLLTTCPTCDEGAAAVARHSPPRRRWATPPDDTHPAILDRTAFGVPPPRPPDPDNHTGTVTGSGTHRSGS